MTSFRLQCGRRSAPYPPTIDLFTLFRILFELLGMGCWSSREAQAADRPPRPIPQIGAPQDVTIHIPRNRADAHEVPVQRTNFDIPREVLEHALSMMAHYIQQRNTHITAIAIGGAVNTLLLRSRTATHDVDIFGTNLNNQTRFLLDEAMQYAIQQTQQPLGTDWFNTETQMWMSPQIHQDLTQRAIQQNIIVFERPGLTLLAAPWNYAFGSKVSRLLTGSGNARPYDLADALTYLNEIITFNRGPVGVDRVMQWAARYNQDTNENFLLNTINPQYHTRFGRPGIVREDGVN